MKIDPTDRAIAEYLCELDAEAELARDDLEELEDHMRSLIAELRATGASSEVAIAQAKLRLGDPRSLAREHARVRSPFGAKLSRTRAWSAGGLFFLMLVLGFVMYGGGSKPVGWYTIELAIGAVLAGALVARLAWARAAVLGYVGYALLHLAVIAGVHGDGLTLASRDFVIIAIELGILAFVMPWRRREVGAAGIALALISVMYMGASWVIGFEISAPHLNPEAIAGHVAQVTSLVAGIGIVMRARWAAFGSAIAATSMIVAASLLLDVTLQFEGAVAVRTMLIGTVIAGAVAAVICSVVSWRTARSRLGSLRGFAS